MRYISLLLFIGLGFSQDITIAVLNFEGQGVSQSETKTLTDRLRDEIHKTGIYIVLERGKMDEVLKEQGFQHSGCVTSECAVEVGNMLGVQQMIGGSIGKVGSIYTVSARVIDVQTGEVLKSANYDHIGDIGQLLLKGMKEVAHELLGLKYKKSKSQNTNKNDSLSDSDWDVNDSKISSDQFNLILTIARENGVNPYEISKNRYGVHLKSLNNKQAYELINYIQTTIGSNNQYGQNLITYYTYSCIFIFGLWAMIVVLGSI